MVKRILKGDVDSDGRLPTGSQTKQVQALGRSWCTCNADPSPYNPTPRLAGATPGLASPAPSDWLGCAVRPVRSLDWSPGKGLRTTGWKTLQAAGARVAAPHFCFPFQHSVYPPSCFRKGTPFLTPEPWGWDGGHLPPAVRALKIISMNSCPDR